MRMPRVLCAVILALSLASFASAAPIYVWSGGAGTAATWSDVNKASVTGAPDSLLCWAAAASNVLAWTGWEGWNSATSSYMSTSADIYAYFDAHWSNSVGAAIYAYEWWMTDRTTSYFNAAKTFETQGQDFYPTVTVGGTGSVTAFVPGDTDIFNYMGIYINAGRGVVAVIDVPSGPGGSGTGAYLHSISVWGWDSDPAAMKVWLTDSDDGLTELREYTFYLDQQGRMWIQDYSNLYTSPVNVMIDELTRLNWNENGILPTHETTPGTVPEPASMILLGTGLSGLLVARRKARKR